MSFPFSAPTRELRQQILLVLAASGLLGACGDEFAPPSCDDDVPPTKTCMTREQMNALAERRCPGGLPLGPGNPPMCSERTPAEIAALFDENECLVPNEVPDGCCNPAPNPGEPQANGSCCYYHCKARVCCGRPLLVAGESRLAGVERRDDWLSSSSSTTLQLTDAMRARIAGEWLQDARMEHASVAAFARFTLELLGFGAPVELVAEAQRAGLDEVAHASACFSLAQHFDGVARGPAPLELTGLTPAGSLADAVRCTFLEGCVGETQAALLAQHALLVARDPAARAALEQIALDEARHSALAWRFVAWAVKADPECAKAVEAALAICLQPIMETQPLDDDETRAMLHAAGRLTSHERVLIARQALADIIAPCAGVLLRAAGDQPERNRAAEC